MSAIDLEQSLAELVLEKPGLARIFEEMGLDYCCGGQASLADAAARHGLDARALLLALEADTETGGGDGCDRDWRQESFASLCDHIVSLHHAYLRRELPRLEELLGKVVSRHGDTLPTVPWLQLEFAALHGELIDHIDREEQGLFPLCEELDGDREPGPGTMPQLPLHEAAHANVGTRLARMRELGGGYDPATALCTTHGVLLGELRELELDLHRHVHEENNVLFPRLRTVFGEASVPSPGAIADA